MFTELELKVKYPQRRLKKFPLAVKTNGEFVCLKVSKMSLSCSFGDFLPK
jgi:hypothetical protein